MKIKPGVTFRVAVRDGHRKFVVERESPRHTGVFEIRDDATRVLYYMTKVDDVVKIFPAPTPVN